MDDLFSRPYAGPEVFRSGLLIVSSLQRSYVMPYQFLSLYFSNGNNTESRQMELVLCSRLHLLPNYLLHSRSTSNVLIANILTPTSLDSLLFLAFKVRWVLLPPSSLIRDSTFSVLACDVCFVDELVQEGHKPVYFRV